MLHGQGALANALQTFRTAAAHQRAVRSGCTNADADLGHIPSQVENELKEVDAKFSRLHGVPAGRALDLYGRVVGGPTTASPEAAPAARKQGSRTRGHASTLKCGSLPVVHDSRQKLASLRHATPPIPCPHSSV